MLVVGTGQSGAQIAEDLHLAGRRVHLAVGTAPRVARFYRGRDVVAWLHDMGHYDQPIDDHPMGLQAAAGSQPLRHRPRRRPRHRPARFAIEGMRLHGRLLGADGELLRFADDLATNLDHADKVAERAKDTIDRWIVEQGHRRARRRPLPPAVAPGAQRAEHARPRRRRRPHDHLGDRVLLGLVLGATCPRSTAPGTPRTTAA